MDPSETLSTVNCANQCVATMSSANEMPWGTSRRTMEKAAGSAGIAELRTVKGGSVKVPPTATASRPTTFPRSPEKYNTAGAATAAVADRVMATDGSENCASEARSTPATPGSSCSRMAPSATTSNWASFATDGICWCIFLSTSARAAFTATISCCMCSISSEVRVLTPATLLRISVAFNDASSELTKVMVVETGGVCSSVLLIAFRNSKCAEVSLQSDALFNSGTR
mmetsp:Transcript_10445/g.11920  ORF Transcript_10445/g.11920 Transcript_10445/m.11920 type:complete len:227 (+) Transcript_10445:509-1189(+)